MFKIQDLKNNKIILGAESYIGIKVGKGTFSKVIQEITKDISGLPADKTASHILALAWCGEWFIYESDMKMGGAVRYPLDEFVRFHGDKGIIFHEFSLNVKALEYYNKHNPGYGYFDVASKLPVIDELLKKNNGSGLICSEYIAIATDYEICKDLNLPKHAITPAHYQVWEKLKLTTRKHADDTCWSMACLNERQK